MARLRKFSKKGTIAVIAAVLIVGGGLLYMVKHKHRETIHVAAASTTQKAANAQSKASGKKIPASNSSPNGTDNAKSSSVSSSATVNVPFGTFVSNHKPNFSGQSGEESVCMTSPGATCYIEFTKGNTVKQLPVQTAGSDGGVYWHWDIKQAGLTTGTWQIQAVATLNGQTKSAQDKLGLEVQP